LSSQDPDGKGFSSQHINPHQHFIQVGALHGLGCCW